MAKGEKFYTTVEKMVVTCEEGVQLRLSYIEAETLMMAINRIGGHPEKSRRKHIDLIRAALLASGLGIDNYPLQLAEGVVSFVTDNE